MRVNTIHIRLTPATKHTPTPVYVYSARRERRATALLKPYSACTSRVIASGMLHTDTCYTPSPTAGRDVA